MSKERKTMNTPNQKFDTIKTFIRLDEDVWALLSNQKFLTNVKVIGHHAIWASEDIPAIREWLNYQPKDSYFTSKFNYDYMPVNKTTGNERIYIGVSLSQASAELLAKVSKSKLSLRCLAHEFYVSQTATVNPNLFTSDDGWWWVKPNLSDETINIVRDLLKHHDFYYEYSDSHSVYQNGDKQFKTAKSAALAVGVCSEDFLKVYRDISSGKLSK